MKMGKKSFFIAFTAAILCSVASNAGENIHIIPKPQEITIEEGSFKTDAGTKLYTNLKGKERTLFYDYIGSLPCKFSKGKAKDGSNVIRLIVGQVEGTENYEAYSLNVTSSKVEIIGNSPEGIFNGLQTMFQLSGGITQTLEIPCVNVSDEPRFHYRGYMLDVSRHFFSKEFVLKMLDILSYYKINVFHFHIQDTGGWRIESKKYPELTNKTAYRTKEDLNDWWQDKNRFCAMEDEGAYGGYYTQEDIQEIVAFATERHIEIIPEIDMPGHARSILWAYPEYACEGRNASNSNELCLGNEKTYMFCEDVLSEIMQLFPSKYIHIGGDEADRQIWHSCPKCTRLMQDEGIDNVSELQGYFTRHIQEFLDKHGKTVIGWDEIVDGKINRNTVVMSWREESDNGKDALKSGYRVIQSPTSHCYLDYFQDNPYFEPEGILGYTPLEKTYSFDPAPKGDYDNSLVLGVQGNLWTEHIPTVQHAEYMTFPRILAIAEVGWTYPEQKSYPEFKERAFEALDYLRKERDVHPFNLSTELGPRPESLIPAMNAAKSKKILRGDTMNEYPEAEGVVDGLLGNWNGNGDRWIQFGNNMDVVIDMGRTSELHAVKGYFLKVLTGGMYLPDSLEISFSDDGKNFRQVLKQEIRTDYTKLYDIMDYGWIGLDTARYIRFHATMLSDWGNILCDEIIVK